ncbi:MAG TPA: heme o synthase [Polyangiaceae bacterium]|jgi:protoheme IX farnesyltransferase|nr:heme o synthase [Polyangiaceae bacterium]
MTPTTEPLASAAATSTPAVPSLRDLLALTKPRITLLSVTTAAAGLALARERVTPGVLVSVVVGTALVVGSANSLNMYLEREIDGRMARTRSRPLPAGRVRPGLALGLGILQGLAGLLILTLGANVLTAFLAALALLVYVLVYTPLKQRSLHALWVGAVAGAMPPLLGWSAATGGVSTAALALFGLLFVWQIPHFLAIALFRRDEYRNAGLKVLPNEHGERATRWGIFVGLLLQLLLTLALPPLGLGGSLYIIGVAAFGSLLLGWSVIGLVRPVDDEWARRLFLLTVAFLPLLFALLIAS